MDIQILDKFEGASIGNSVWEGNTLKVQLRREPICAVDGREHDYNLHFTFGLRNDSPNPATFQVEVEPGNRKGLLHEADLFVRADLNRDFQTYPKQAQTDQFRYFTFPMTLQPFEKKIVSNTLMRPYTSLGERFRELSRASRAKDEVIGHSVEGRPIFAYSWEGAGWASDGPSLLITSGLHPVEPDTLATENIMEYLTTPTGKEILEGLRLVIVPISNPDGFIHGYNGCNVRGINYFWDFRYQDDQNCPEASALWKLIERISPWVYVDFHAYTIQGDRRKAGPYMKPIRFYQGTRWRTLSGSIHQNLNSIPNTAPRIMFAPSSLSQLILERLNTISIAKYHLHLGNGLEACRGLGLEVIQRIIFCLKRYIEEGGTSCLFQPYGKKRKNPFLVLLRKMEIERHYWRRHFQKRGF